MICSEAFLFCFLEVQYALEPDPHADPPHEISQRIHGTQWSEYHAESEPKAQKSTQKGALDDLQAVGKDEVGSSNLPSSSRKPGFR